MKYLFQRVFVALLPSGVKRTKYIIKHKIFEHTGSNFYFCPRKLPADPKLIKFHDNVAVATNVMFINHDVMQKVFNNVYEEKVPKYFGCIEIGNNVFIGANSTILPNVKICDNVIIAAGTLVTKSIFEPGIWGGIPARRIGNVDDLYEKRIEYKKTIFNSDDRVYHESLWKHFDKSNN